jgi:hypothetical protein
MKTLTPTTYRVADLMVEEKLARAQKSRCRMCQSADPQAEKYPGMS